MEIRTQPVRARATDKAQFSAENIPGSFYLSPPDDDGELLLHFRCPCGCGHRSVILVGDGFKPAGDEPSWHWNGSLACATLTPSVHRVGHWHGWLRNGVWESV
jgi:hypothetical protein